MAKKLNGQTTVPPSEEIPNCIKKKSKWRVFCDKIHDTLFPARIKCIVCGDDLPNVSNIEVCENCITKLEFITDKYCHSCGAPVLGEAKYCFNCKDNVRDFDIGRSVFVYDGVVVGLISGLKFGNKPYFARTLAQFMARLYNELGWQIDFVVPVPMTEKRIKIRGYNQAEVLAREFCEITGLPLNTEVLIKTKDTGEQKELTMLQRQQNIKDAFCVTDKNLVKNRNVLIIDDVMTTGATASACAHVFKKSQAKQVFIITIAHGKPNIPSQNNLENIKSVINSVK